MHTAIQYMKNIAFQISGEEVNTSLNDGRLPVEKRRWIHTTHHTLVQPGYISNE